MVKFNFAILLCFHTQFYIEGAVFECAEDSLYRYLFGNRYNKYVKPSISLKDVMIVTLKLSVTQLVDVDEKNLLMTTNIWLAQSWYDINLRWNPEEYGGITSFLVPPSDIWKPDIVLLDNADGNFTVTHYTKARLYHDGRILWKPPAIYKTACNMDVRYFPFDTQKCTMHFASWSYNGQQLQLQAHSTDLTTLIYNGEWDVVDSHVAAVPGTNDSVSSDVFSHPKISMTFVLRRLPLFYCAFLIAPCLGISFLTGLVFYLPSDSQEKITLCISVLLAHTFYLLVITEIIPASSNVIPLISEYLLFNMIFITLAIVLTTIALNVHNRADSSHGRLPPFLRYLVFEKAPKMLCMRRPDEQYTFLARGLLFRRENLLMGRHLVNTLKKTFPKNLCEELGGAIESGFYIAEKIKLKIDHKCEKEEWKYIAMVMDRIFLCLFLTISVLGIFILVVPVWMDTSDLHYAHAENHNNVRLNEVENIEQNIVYGY